MKKRNENLIIKLVLNKFGVNKQELFSANRYQEVVNARAIVASILRYYGYSFPEIGRLLGRDHTTIIYSCNKVKNDEWLSWIENGVISEVTEITMEKRSLERELFTIKK